MNWNKKASDMTVKDSVVFTGIVMAFSMACMGAIFGVSYLAENTYFFESIGKKLKIKRKEYITPENISKEEDKED